MESVNVTRNSKCFSEINSLIIIIASISISFEYRLNGIAEYKHGDYAVLEGLSLGKSVRLPLHGPIESALKNLKPDLIEIIVEDNKLSTQTCRVNSTALPETIYYIILPFFISFYARNYSEASKGFGKDFSSWPNSWKIGWVLRNALAHNGKVLFKDLTTPPIYWKGIVISPVDQDKPIKGILNFTDMLLLVFDMESDLNLVNN